ncbi:MAG: hypothetical protein AAF772_07425 [Acidobacteriota bacterium]
MSDALSHPLDHSPTRRTIRRWISLLALTALLLGGAVASTADEAAKDDDAPPALSNTLRWATASEVDNFGYDVYRGEAEDGPFERVTETPVRGAGTTDEPQHYVFTDDTIAPETVYWYYVESISLTGHRERFTPIFAAKAKPAPSADGDGEGDADGGTQPDA